MNERMRYAVGDYVRELRKLIGSRPAILCGAGVIIINAKEEILLQHRMDNDLWAVPGGAVELGETVEETATREVFEETGLKVGNLKLLGIYSGEDTYYKYPNGDEVYWITIAFISNEFEGELRPDNYESKECKFFSVDELPENFIGIDRLILNDYLKIRGYFFTGCQSLSASKSS
nr:NUDIX hydrolase [Tissierella praeacuta]